MLAQVRRRKTERAEALSIRDNEPMPAVRAWIEARFTVPYDVQGYHGKARQTRDYVVTAVISARLLRVERRANGACAPKHPFFIELFKLPGGFLKDAGWVMVTSLREGGGAAYMREGDAGFGTDDDEEPQKDYKLNITFGDGSASKHTFYLKLKSAWL